MSIKHYKKVVGYLARRAGITEMERAIAMEHPSFYMSKINDRKTYRVVMTDHGKGKIAVIKEVRRATGMGLREAKDLVESTPAVIIESDNPQTASNVTSELLAAGANCYYEPVQLCK